MVTLSTAVLCVLIVTVVGEIPENYILDIRPYCGSGAVQDAKVEILTDLYTRATAVCDGNSVDFGTPDDVNFRLAVSYPGQGDGSQPCVFRKRADVMVFDITVKVAFGERPGLVDPNSIMPGRQVPSGLSLEETPGLVHEKEEIWTVTCSFGDWGTGVSWKKDDGTKVVEGHIAKSELLSNMGPELTDANLFTLEMVDVAGGPLGNQFVHLGRTVQLRGVSNDHNLRPVACFAMDNSSSAYAILRGGCGDGIVFEKNAGFAIKGKTMLSPYFSAFKLNFYDTITFKCTVLMEEDNWVGNSCAGFERKRREAGDSAFPNTQTIAQLREKFRNKFNKTRSR